MAGSPLTGLSTSSELAAPCYRPTPLLVYIPDHCSREAFDRPPIPGTGFWAIVRVVATTSVEELLTLVGGYVRTAPSSARNRRTLGNFAKARVPTVDSVSIEPLGSRKRPVTADMLELVTGVSQLVVVPHEKVITTLALSAYDTPHFIVRYTAAVVGDCKAGQYAHVPWRDHVWHRYSRLRTRAGLSPPVGASPDLTPVGGRTPSLRSDIVDDLADAMSSPLPPFLAGGPTSLSGILA